MSCSIAAARFRIIAWQRSPSWVLPGGRAVVGAHHALSNSSRRDYRAAEHAGSAVVARHYSGDAWDMAGTTTTAPLSGEGEGCAQESVRGYPRKAEDRIATTSTLVYNGRQNRDAVRMASPARAVATGRGCSGILSLYTGSPKHGAARMLPLSHRLLRTDGRIVQPTGRSSGKRQTGSLSVNKEDAAAVAWVEQPPLELAGYLSVYKELSKIKLSGLVVLTTMVGYAMAPGEFSGTELFLTTLGTSFCVASANTLNQWVEVPYDSQMNRTKNRPVVRGAISPLHALAVGVGFGLAGAGVLCTTVNHATAFMGTGNTILYAGVYTYMKRTSIYNTWVGSVVGAVPPLIGWVAATGSIDTGGLVLAAALYAWQFPHFNALSWNLRGDYSRAGYRMMSVTDPKLCRSVALRYSAAMIPISLMASYCGMCDWWLAVDSTLINGFLTYRAWQFYKDANDQTARKLFMASIWHLPALLILYMIHKVYSDDDDDENGDGADAAGEDAAGGLASLVAG